MTFGDVIGSSSRNKEHARRNQEYKLKKCLTICITILILSALTTGVTFYSIFTLSFFRIDFYILQSLLTVNKSVELYSSSNHYENKTI